jgi:hypothetical protein
MSLDERLESLRARANSSPYTEPVSEYAVHVDNGQMAFVRFLMTRYAEPGMRTPGAEGGRVDGTKIWRGLGRRRAWPRVRRNKHPPVA